MTHTKHRKRRERARREQEALIPGYREMWAHMRPPTLLERYPPLIAGRTGRAG